MHPVWIIPSSKPLAHKASAPDLPLSPPRAEGDLLCDTTDSAMWHPWVMPCQHRRAWLAVSRPLMARIRNDPRPLAM
jgi:hypothetical protein